MTAQTDLDSKLRAWLDLMPDEAPDRAIASVLQAVDATPQARPALRWPTWRPFTMQRISVAVGALAVVAIAGVLLLSGQGNRATVGGSPSPAGSAAAVASAAQSAPAAPSGSATGPIPGDLQHRWMGGTSGIAEAGAGSSLLIGESSLSLNEAAGDNHVAMTASAGSGAGDQLVVTTDGPRPRCAVADQGTFAWSLSPSGRTLTLTGDDGCALRGGALDGTWWQMGCKDPQDDCLGLLDVGTYQSEFINPIAAPGSPWRPKFGGITYTVPDGWANDQDWPGKFSLSTADSFARWTQQNGTPSGVLVLADAHASSQATPCSGMADPQAASTPDGIVAALRHIAGLQVGPSTPVVIGGRSGVQVDLTANNARLRPCGSDRVIEYLYAAETGIAVDPASKQRLILLDIGGTSLAIQIATDKAGFDALAGAAMPIIESMHFQ
jgi:hypothetical protein